MSIRVETVTLPAFLASALVNGDTSGLEPEDEKWLKAAEEYVAPGVIVSCEGESFFSRYCDLPGFRLGADMIEYVVHYHEDDNG